MGFVTARTQTGSLMGSWCIKGEDLVIEPIVKGPKIMVLNLPLFSMLSTGCTTLFHLVSHFEWHFKRLIGCEHTKGSKTQIGYLHIFSTFPGIDSSCCQLTGGLDSLL